VSPSVNRLVAADALSASDVWAVGCSFDSSANCHTLAEHWNGSSWSVVPSPDHPGAAATELDAVSGTSSSDVWAVGEFVNGGGTTQPFTMHWNGSAWVEVQTPTVFAGFLAAVAISPTDVWAVGASIAEHWDGSQWTIVPLPTIGRGTVLQGITAISSNNVWAVGDFDDDTFSAHSLIMRWDGTSWARVTSPDTGANSQLYSISPVSTADIWAVGVDFPSTKATLAEHWNGTTWTVVPGPDLSPSLLEGVTAVSSSDVWAVGYSVVPGGPVGIEDHTLAERWNGSSWTVSTTPTTSSAFTAVTAAPGTIFAVGSAGVGDENGPPFLNGNTLAESHAA
jgi:hypothetical protein